MGHYLSPILRLNQKGVRASDAKPIQECAADELDKLQEHNARQRAALEGAERVITNIIRKGEEPGPVLVAVRAALKAADGEGE